MLNLYLSFFYFLFFIFYFFYVSTVNVNSEIQRSECFNKSRVPDFAGKESNSSQTAIIIVVSTISSAVLIISSCIYMYLRAKNEREKIESNKLEIGLPFLVAKC